MSKWITDRMPTAEDAFHKYVWVSFQGHVRFVLYYHVEDFSQLVGFAWRSIEPPPPPYSSEVMP
jgi:hypothetical protein